MEQYFDFRHELEVTLERYVGGARADLKRIDRYFDQLIAMSNDPIHELNKSDTVKSIAKEVGQIFGFRKVNFKIINEPYISMLTYTKILTITNRVARNENDIHTNKSVFHCVITKGTLQIPGLTGAECTAMLLHEIGHNMDSSYISSIVTALGGIQNILVSMIGKTIVVGIGNINHAIQNAVSKAFPKLNTFFYKFYKILLNLKLLTYESEMSSIWRCRLQIR